MIPYIIIIIFGIIGLIFWGLKGLVGGLFFGYLFSFLFGLIVTFVESAFNVGIIKKKYRRAIASSFVSENLSEILRLSKFRFLKNEQIINIFANHISEMFNSAIKIDNPVKKHSHDLNYSQYEENFLRGANEIWLKKFNDHHEHRLMEKYIDFCVKEMYHEFYKYG